LFLFFLTIDTAFVPADDYQQPYFARQDAQKQVIGGVGLTGFL
jgi:hypothetical protein